VGTYSKGRSYAYSTDLSTRALATVTDVAQVVLLSEWGQSYNAFARGCGSGDYTWSWITQKGVYANHGFLLRHNDGTNYAFVDGHVKWLKMNAVTQNSSTSSAAWFTPS
jgi:prepilin-type processing-associated H-X9-DG protein